MARSAGAYRILYAYKYLSHSQIYLFAIIRSKHMKTDKYPNLTPWKPGQSGNPAGRKLGSKNISSIVQELLNQEADNFILTKSSVSELTQGASTSYARAVVFAAINKALQGNMQAIIWLSEQQEHRASTQDAHKQEPLVISVISPRNNSAVD